MSDDRPLTAGDRVRFRGEPVSPERHAELFPGATAGPAAPLERVGTLLADPQGDWVRVQYDDQQGPASALVETLTRVEERPR